MRCCRGAANEENGADRVPQWAVWTFRGAGGFQGGVTELGWVEGKDINFEYRYGGNDLDKLSEFATELVRLNVGAQIGSHFFVDHCTGTVVGETCVIGEHVKMYQGVGLVAKSLAAGQQLSGQKRHPTIEDYVTIYAGATIMGGDTVVGEASTIGENVFLTQSVPPHSLVIQEEANIKVMNKKDRPKKPAVDFTV